ncbi:MAG: hypothetical protein ACKOQM_01380 [Novosphingobium sp.]
MRIGQGIGKRAALAAVMLTIGHAAPAFADTAPITAYYRDPALVGYVYPGPASAIINIDVKASVGGTCGFATNGAPNASFTGLPIEGGWTRQVPFTAECTAPWRIAVSSTNGAMKTSAVVPVGYTNKAAYDVALNVASDSGTVTGTCPVAQLDQALGSSPCNFKGTATTTNGLQVPRSFGLSGSFIQMTAPAYTGTDVLVSGTYDDTLVVTVSPAV